LQSANPSYVGAAALNNTSVSNSSTELYKSCNKCQILRILYIKIVKEYLVKYEYNT